MQDEHDTTLVFESRFESGNLRRAIQVSCSYHVCTAKRPSRDMMMPAQVFEYEYDLILAGDVNAPNHTQW